MSLTRPAALMVAFAGLNGAIAVAAAALAAHGLGEPAAGLTRTAAEIQLVHAVALLALAGLNGRWTGRAQRAAEIAVAAIGLGVVLFAGGVYASAAEHRIGIAPYGGVLLILGWVALTIAGLLSGRRRSGD